MIYFSIHLCLARHSSLGHELDYLVQIFRWWDYYQRLKENTAHYLLSLELDFYFM